MTEHGGHDELARGDWGTVAALVLPDGSCPASEWLSGLNDRQWAAITARINRLSQVGWLKSPDDFRWLQVPGDPPIAEIKHISQNLRLYAIQRDRTWYVTHGRTKPKDRQVPGEVERARRIIKESLN